MGVSGGPNIITDNLVLDLDAANAQSYPNYYNLMLNTQTFSSGSYAGQGLNTTGTPAWVNVGTAPDGTSTSFALIPTSGSALHRFYYTFPYISGSIYTFSCYAKSGSRSQFEASLSFTALGSNWRTAAFSLVGTGSVISSNGNAGVTPTITSVGDGWYRCTFTNLCTTTVADQLAFGYSNNSYSGDGTTTEIQVWGAQMNLGTTALPYQQITTYPTQWSDLSPSLASSSLTNGAYYNIYPITKAIGFDGTDDYAKVPINLNYTEGTIMCWAYSTITGSNFFAYTANNAVASYSHQLGISSANKLHSYIYDGASKQFDGTDQMDINKWYHCVFWWKDNNFYGSYLNGVSQGSASINTAWKSGSNFWVGSSSGTNNTVNKYLRGNISSLQIYNRALSATEILQNYNATKGRFGL